MQRFNLILVGLVFTPTPTLIISHVVFLFVCFFLFEDQKKQSWYTVERGQSDYESEKNCFTGPEIMS